MKRRILELLFVLAMIMVLVPGSVFAAETASGTCGENLTWTLDNLGLLTISGSGKMMDYSSESTVPWYEYRESVTSLVIDEGVASLNKYAFYDCTALETVYFDAANVEDLASSNYAFYRAGINSDGVEVIFGDDVTKIPAHLFHVSSYSADDSANILSVSFEENSICESVGGWAFHGCSALTSITIPKSVASIGEYAFYCCFNLLIQIDAAEFPESLGTSWDTGAAICVNPKRFGVTEYGQQYWITNENTICVWKYDGSDTDVVIPETIEGYPVVEIAVSSFYNCTEITSISIPDNVKTIGSYAFYNCTGLTSITIPENVTTIGKDAFYNCTSIESIYYNAIAIDDFTPSTEPFGFTSPTNNNPDVSLVIGSSVTRIPAYLFYSYHTTHALPLTIITFEDGSACESIGDSAFWRCTTMTSIVIPESVTSIGSRVFECCYDLLVQFEANELPATLGSHWSGDAAVCLNAVSFGTTDYGQQYWITSDNTACVWKYNGTDTTVVIPEEIDGAPVVGIAASAFCENTTLVSITIPEYVTSIGDYAFGYCTHLKELNFNATDVEDLESSNYVFYQAGIRGDGLTVTFGSNVEEVPAYLFFPYSSADYAPNIVSVLFEDGCVCQSIGQYAFAYCTSMTNICFSEQLTTISSYAFRNCTGLTNVIIPASVKDVETAAFSGCGSLTTAGPIGGGYDYEFGWTEEIPGNAFYGLTGLTSVTLPKTITNIGDYAFYNCNGLQEIEIPKAVANIGNYAFYTCSGLTSITIPESVTTIGGDAFHGCSSLTSITIPDSVTRIGEAVFQGCSSLNSITIPKSVTSIGRNAFYYCKSLTNVYYGGTKEQWAEIELGYSNACLTNATIHYNCDNSSSDKSDTVIDGSVFFFREWDAEKQVAYFDNTFMGAEISEETDPTFLENVEKLVGNFVLVEFIEQKNDGMIVSPIIRNAVLVDAREGCVTTADSDYIVIDGKRYVTPENITLPGLYANSKVRYFLYKDELVGIELIDSESPETSDSGYYGVFEEATEDEIILHEYKHDWEKAYNDFASAVTAALEKFSGTDSETQTASIVAEAKRMQESDDASNSKYLSGDLGSYKSWAYRALAEFFYENTCSTFDLASIDLSKDFAGAKMVNNILKSFYGKTESYRYGNIQVDLVVNTMYSVRFGSLTVYDVNRKESSKKTALICSTREDCEAAIKDYMEELQSLATNSAYNIANAVSKDILKKPLSSLSESYLKEKADMIERRLAVKLTEKFNSAGVGNLISNINQCYSYYKYVNKVIELGKNIDIEGITKELSNFEIKDTTIKDAGVKKTTKALNKAAKKFLKAYESYIAGTLTEEENSFWNLVFKCPVNVSVYNTNGEQIGYVGEDDLWYTDDIEIIELGGAKQILVRTEDLLTFEVTSFDYGTMDCTIEQNDENFNPIGRLNYYDITLMPEQQFSVSLTDEVIDDTETLVIKTGDEEILADEYISSTDKAEVEIICTPEADDGSAGGTVSGGGTYVRGDAVILRASEEDGYTFVGWVENNLLLSIDEIYEFSAKNDLSISAKFVFDDFKYVYTSTKQGGYTVGDGRYESGETATVIAESFSNYQFEGWYESDILVSKEREYSFSVMNDVYLEARFTFVNPFTDLANPSSYYDAVLWAVDKGITKGTSDTEFSPKEDCTRAQIVTFLWRYAGEPEPTSTKHKFVDLVEDSSYYKAVLWAVEKGITNGVDDTHFGPKEPCTRAQIVTFLWRAAGKPQPSSKKHNFTDIVKGSSYYDAVLWAVEKGITTGADTTHFNPKDTCTRAQGMTFLYRYHNTK